MKNNKDINENGYVFKFRTMDKYSLVGLANATLWFAKMESFNDPFEGKYKKNEDLTDVEWEKLFNKYIKEIDGDIKKVIFENDNFENKYEKYKVTMNMFFDKYIENIRDNFGFLSLIKDSVVEPCTSNFNMWAHYADGMRGFCIVFNKMELLESLRLKNKDSKFGMYDIKYLDEIVSNKWNLNKKGRCIKLEEVLEIVNSKNKAFKNEKEARITCNSIGLKKYSRESVKAIFIGEKMPKDEIELLKQIVKYNYPKVKIFKSKFSREDYKITSYAEN